MSHFVCDYGKTYYIFGKSNGKSNILNKMEEINNHTKITNPQKIKNYNKLMNTIKNDCPYFNVPMVSSSKDTSTANDKINEIILPIANSCLIELLKLQIKSQLVIFIDFIYY